MNQKPEVKLKFIPKCQCPIQPTILSTFGVVIACAECGRLYETVFEIHNLLFVNKKDPSKTIRAMKEDAYET